MEVYGTYLEGSPSTEPQADRKRHQLVIVFRLVVGIFLVVVWCFLLLGSKSFRHGGSIAG